MRDAVWEGLDALLLALKLGESRRQPRNAGGLEKLGKAQKPTLA